MLTFFNTKPVLKLGCISGLLLVLNELMIYASTNENPFIGERTSNFAIIGLIIPVVAVVLGILILKKQNQINSFASILKPGVMIGFITGLIYIAYFLLFTYSIEPDTLEKFEIINKKRLIASGQIINSEDLKNAVQLSKNAFLPSTILFSLAINMFIGFITSIVTAIFVRNK